MLRLLSLTAFALFGAAQAVSDVQVILFDDDLDAGDRHVRVSFRGHNDETGVVDYRACGCDALGDLSDPGIADCSDAVTPNGQNKEAQPTGTGNMASTYNSMCFI